MDQYENFPILFKGQNFTTGGSYCELGVDLGCAGEDISDNGGVKIAYRAFQNSRGRAKEECIPGLPFTANQLFWVRFSQFNPLLLYLPSLVTLWTGVLSTTSDIQSMKIFSALEW